MFIPAVVGVVFFSLVAIVWVEARRKERQAFYFTEMVRKVAETSGTSAAEFLRETERIKRARIREGMLIGGLVGSLAAVGLLVFLHGIVREEPVYLVALIPLLSCVGLLVYARFLASRE